MYKNNIDIDTINFIRCYFKERDDQMKLESLKNPNNYPIIKIHDDFFMQYEDETHDILETYNEKYKMRVTLRFPKENTESKSVDGIHNR